MPCAYNFAKAVLSHFVHILETEGYIDLKSPAH